VGLIATVGAVERLRYIWADSSARVVAIGALFLFASWGILLYEAAAARLSLVTESYARGPRLVLVLQLVGMIALFVWGATERPYAELLAVGSIVCSAHLLLVGIVLASDHDGMARALWLKSSRASLLEPGALRGFRLVALLYGAIALAFVAAHGWMRLPALLTVSLAAPAYGAIYLSAAVILGRLGHVDSRDRPRITRVAALGLVVVGAGGPPLAAGLAGRDPSGVLLNFLNPVMGLVNLFAQRNDSVLHVMGLWGIALGLVLIAQEMLARRDRPHTGST
jgi:hypothetical protein